MSRATCLSTGCVTTHTRTALPISRHLGARSSFGAVALCMVPQRTHPVTGTGVVLQRQTYPFGWDTTVPLFLPFIVRSKSGASCRCNHGQAVNSTPQSVSDPKPPSNLLTFPSAYARLYKCGAEQRSSPGSSLQRLDSLVPRLPCLQNLQTK